MNDPATLAERLPRAAGRTVFGLDAAGYPPPRPGYPCALYRLVAARVPATAVIGEIGPGTGLATEALEAFAPRRFVAFEPDPVLAENLHARFTHLEVLNDDFCRANVEGGFDLIAAASSFHWLDPDEALDKARALLKPGGCLAIWWNVYRQCGIGDPFAEAVAPLLAGLDLPPSEAADRHYSLDVDLHRRWLAGHGFDNFAHRLFRRRRALSPTRARALYASFSLVRLLPPSQQDALLDAIERLVTEQFDGLAPSIVLSPLYLASAPEKP